MAEAEAPAAPQKRSCLIPLDENSLGSSSNVKCRIIKDEEKMVYPNRRRRLMDSSTISSAVTLKTLGLKPLLDSPMVAVKRRRLLIGGNVGDFPSVSRASSSRFSFPPARGDIENESGFFELTPESDHSRSRSFSSRNSSEIVTSPSVYSGPRPEAFPPSYFLFERRKLFNAIVNEDYFSALPDEMILPILKWLPKNSLAQMAKVSQKFNRVANDESLWHRIDVLGKFLTSDNVSVIMARKPVYLRMSQSEVHPPIGLGPEFSAPQLTYLDLTAAVISTPTLTQLLGMCSNLTKLSLENVEVNQDVLVAMNTFSHSIDTLNLTMCSKLPSKPLSAFLNKCSKMKSLNLGCVSQNWTKDDLMTVINSLPVGLEELNMSGFRKTLGDTHAQILTERCTNLVELDLSDCQDLTMLAMEAVSTLDRIQRLGLNRCYSIEMPAYAILGRMKSLRFLEQLRGQLLVVGEALFGPNALETERKVPVICDCNYDCAYADNLTEFS